MKLIEALKEIPALLRKAEDLRKLISNNCSLLDNETPSYGTKEQQTAKVKEWIQSHSDTLKRIEWLKACIAKTNIETEVSIKLSDTLTVKKSISRWIVRRQQLVELERQAWTALSDRGLREERIIQSDKQVIEKKIVRFFDPAERDNKASFFRNEPMLIDSALEITNATTELIEVAQ